MVKVSRVRRWVLVGLVIAGVVIAAMVVFSNRPPYEFIVKFHGQEIRSSSVIDPKISAAWQLMASGRYYKFDAPEVELKDAITTELGRKGKVFASANGHDYSFVVVINPSGRSTYETTSMFRRQIEGRECWVVSFAAKPSWLDQRWEQVKGWFGVKSGTR